MWDCKGTAEIIGQKGINQKILNSAIEFIALCLQENKS